MNILLLLCATLFLAQAEDVVEKIEEGRDLEGSDPAAFSDEELASLRAGSDDHEFEAEVGRLMEIIIHSLYTDRSIFMRELVSNAGDALDKIRYKSLTNKEELGEKADLNIRVKIDKEGRTISIIDSGVGMTAKELTDNLGTVARSGTAKFLEHFAQSSGEGQGDGLSLIGQFGVGFYSAFLVADEVMVISKSNDDDDQHIWTSTADGSFSVSKDPRGNTLGRGTAIVLKLKEDSDEFLEKSTTENLITRYSQFIQYPIFMWDSKVETEEVPLETEEAATDEETDEDDDDELTAEDDDDEDEEEAPTMKKIEKTVFFWRRLNENKPLWTRAKNDITEEEYQTFYKSFTKGTDEALSYTHFKAEGEIEFSSLLYIPGSAPFGMYDNYYTSKSALKLFVRRVLVADEMEDLVPRYLNFVKGLVDSNDLPLNVNREQLQKNKVMKVIGKKITRKALDLLRKMAEEENPSEDDEDDFDDEETEEKSEDETEEAEKPMKYSKFWESFGKSIKLGVIEDSKNRKKLLNLLRFPSTFSPDAPVSLQSYVDRMKDGQEVIYFISAASLDEAKDSPALESVTKRGYEVIFFTDNLDEYMNLNDFDDYTMQAITKEGLDLGEGSAAKKYLEEKEEEFEGLVEWLGEIYGSKVSKTVLSAQLESVPMYVKTTKYGYSANMERIAKGQAFGSKSPTKASKILEVNFRHPLVKSLKEKVAADAEDDSAKDLALLMFDSALLQSGFAIEPENIADFAQRVERIARGSLGVENDEEVEAMPEFADDDDDEEEEEDDEDEDDEDEEEDEEEADEEETDKDEL
jgi:heat shock protein beta